MNLLNKKEYNISNISKVIKKGEVMGSEKYEQLSNDVEMSFSEHVEEFRQRLFFSLVMFLIISGGCFYFLNVVVEIVKTPAVGVKFFQFAPGEYFLHQ